MKSAFELNDVQNEFKVIGNAIGGCCLLIEIRTETNHKFIMLCVFKIRY